MPSSARTKKMIATPDGKLSTYLYGVHFDEKTLRLSLVEAFFFNDAATTEIYTLSLHDALPISVIHEVEPDQDDQREQRLAAAHLLEEPPRSEEHTSELQSLAYLVCRLLLEKKKPNTTVPPRVAKHHTHESSQ